MDVDVELGDLLAMQPQLEWREILAATAIVLGADRSPPFHFPVEINDVPGADVSALQFRIGIEEIDVSQWDRLRRTYEQRRFVELAAVALAGLTLYHAGGHVMAGVAEPPTR